ncbi:MAG: hypothetical protein HC843_01235 [Sphingomonadales bacterium]|nr:hypothetical protein [Sphingomonadales bacterium]
MKYPAIALCLILAACSEGGTDLDPTSTSAEVAAEAKNIEDAAGKAAALVEADANAEITAQEIAAQKERQSGCAADNNKAITE